VNPGELKDRISILELKQYDNTFTWELNTKIWANAEQLNGSNLFSKVGIGVKSIKFTIRKRNNLTLHNAFTWQGKHCFLTDMVEKDGMYYEVTAALIEPRLCTIVRTPEPTKDELNRPVYSNPYNISFPGCLVEKYMGHTQGNPMNTTEEIYVLVTPKAIEINTGELVTVNSIVYNVLIVHSLDEYKNEYEIMVKEDA
jgi:head-tail adaptor